jgi:GTP-binding protein HflX
MGQPLWPTEGAREVALLVGVLLRGQQTWALQDSLDELALLADTAGADIAGRVVCKLDRPHPATFIGRGKAEQLAEQARAQGVSMIAFDDDLTPVQGRNLEELFGLKVLDRTQMILDIFAQRARTREGRLQVELAQAEYLLPRLRREATAFGQQKGGIGLRGPGERQIEIDRRQLQKHMTQIRRDLDEVRCRREELRRSRHRQGWALFALVGYTNAGKSTLLNKLTGATVLADDQLFATLDPTTRKLTLPNKRAALLTDTVGFIRKLPHHLVEAFQATLEEVIQADVLIHVIDAAHPRVDEQIAAVERVLADLGVHDKTVIHVLNKIDQPAAAAQAARLAARLPRAAAVSALTGAGLDDLLHLAADCLARERRLFTLRIPLREAALLAALRRDGQLVSEHYDEHFARLEVRLPMDLAGKFRDYATERYCSPAVQG